MFIFIQTKNISIVHYGIIFYISQVKYIYNNADESLSQVLYTFKLLIVIICWNPERSAERLEMLLLFCHEIFMNVYFHSKEKSVHRSSQAY